MREPIHTPLIPPLKVFPVTTVQNRYNLADRKSEDVVDYCAANGIGFIPWYPLAAGELNRRGGAVARIAKAHNVTGAQVALAWLLRHSPVMLPIPGTPRVAHLKENVAAADVSLTSEDMALLDSTPDSFVMSTVAALARLVRRTRTLLRSRR